MQRELRRKNANGQKNDPMQLEFDPANLILRLNRMQNVLASGNIIDQNKLQKNMMCEVTLEKAKKFHQQLASKHMKEIAQTERHLKIQQDKKADWLRELD